jgi:hypothetical protein
MPKKALERAGAVPGRSNRALAIKGGAIVIHLRRMWRSS